MNQWRQVREQLRRLPRSMRSEILWTFVGMVLSDWSVAARGRARKAQRRREQRKSRGG